MGPIGRKNYLHVDSNAGGRTAAVMYTLLGSTLSAGATSSSASPINRIDELLAWTVAAKWAGQASAMDLPMAA